jgi:hypothetical protein
MPSPNFDALVVRFSRKIDDAVAAAATEGDTITSAKRVEWLNRGIKNWINALVQYNMQLKANRLNPDWERIRSYIIYKTDAVLTAALKIAVSGYTDKVQTVLFIRDHTQLADVNPLPPGKTLSELSSDTNQFNTALFWGWNAGDISVVRGVNADVIYLDYIKQHTDLTVANLTDIGIDVQYFDDILEEAFTLFVKEYPSKDNTARLMVRQ